MQMMPSCRISFSFKAGEGYYVPCPDDEAATMKYIASFYAVV